MQRQKRTSAATASRSSARWSLDEAQAILDEWKTSGETLHGFAQGHGLVPQRLWWWQKRLAGKRRRRGADKARAVAPAFVPVTVRPGGPEAVLATVEIGNGVRVELRVLDGASAAWVVSLVKSLGSAS